MTEERENGKVFFKVNNIEKAMELRKLFEFSFKEDSLDHYKKNAKKIIEEILDDEKEVFFSKEQLNFLTGFLLFVLSEKRYILKQMGLNDLEETDLEVGGYFLADTQALLSVLRSRLVG